MLDFELLKSDFRSISDDVPSWFVVFSSLPLLPSPVFWGIENHPSGGLGGSTRSWGVIYSVYGVLGFSDI